MHVWRVETVDGVGPYHHCRNGNGLMVGHNTDFASPDCDWEDNLDIEGETLYLWLREGFGGWGYDPERTHVSAPYVCGMESEESLRAVFCTMNAKAHDTFTVTCYEVPPLYCILLNSQILFDRRFATIITRVSY